MPKKKPSDGWAYESVPYSRLSLIREDRKNERPTLRDPAMVRSFFATRLNNEPSEVMAAVYLDTRHRAITWSVLYRGTVNRAAVEPRGILQAALLCNAATFVLAHNHPSGDPTPSAEDLAFTRRIHDAADMVGIQMLDHVIVAGREYASLRERGAF